MRAHHLGEVVRSGICIFDNWQRRTSRANSKVVESNLWHTRKLWNGWHNIGEAKLGEKSRPDSTKRLVHDFVQSRIAYAGFVHRIAAQGLGIAKINHLVPARGSISEPWLNRVRVKQIVTIIEVITGEQTEAGIRVDSSASFIIL